MRRLVAAVMAVTLAVATVPAPVLAGNHGRNNKGHGRGAGNGGSVTEHVIADAITVTERTIISNWLHQHAGNLPPVFAEAKPLPPGIAKNLARGKPLPPGIAKQRFPAGLLSQLPHRPGHEWAVVGNDIVLIAAATGIVVGILHLAGAL